MHVAGAAAVLALAGALAAPASAAPSDADWRSHYTKAEVRKGGGAAEGSGARALGAQSYNLTRYGYTGTFQDGSRVMDVNWFGSGRYESFGIAPGRSIWHAWPGSGSWKQMPNGGLADDTSNAYENRSTGQRVVEVWVAGSNSLWCISDPGNGVWGGWWNCT